MPTRKIKRVLIFPGGNEIGLEIRRALKDCKEITLFSASNNVSNHAPYVYERHFYSKGVNEDGWLEELNKIIEENKIDYIYPAHDYIIDALNNERSKVKAKIVLPPAEICGLIRSKKKTYEYFKDLLPVARIFDSHKEITSFPVFIKPDKEHGAKGAKRIDDAKMLEAALEADKDLIVLEHLPGKEYTIDCFTSRKKGLLFCAGRERVRIRMGTSMDSQLVDSKTNEIFQKYAEIISEKLKISGAWFFQTKKDASGTFKLLEIAPRIAGTMAINRVRGVNFPLLSIYDMEGIDIDILINDFEVKLDRSLENCYLTNLNYSKVYIDLDDTLVVHNKVNTEILQFLYQAISKKCKVILLTKSLSNDLNEYLKKYRLSNIFNEVVWIKEDEKKADYIDSKDAIFIDDSFVERKDVAKRLKIPTFDSSMIEILLDHRR